ncbi:hypothetical protein KI387_009620 [Taxus chinensis]|uniref:ATP-dependent Clp protease proteolytic subunit n=1 Tax=Taxus chinensis TaxID=29808 RepID=A0AA38FJQ8_TAXCH|nr:hypothetical protein KI387_009620 [Taxus chinensis]
MGSPVSSAFRYRSSILSPNAKIPFHNNHSPCRSLHLLSHSYSYKNVSSIPKGIVGNAQMNGMSSSFSARQLRDEWKVVAEQSGATAQRSGEGDVMGLLLKDRTVILGNYMNDFVADAIVSQLLLLDAKDPTKDIRLFINCSGGSYSAAMAIFDAIQFCRADVSTIGLGICASTASIVLAAGSRGKRLAMPNTRIMMHQPMGGISGEVSNVEVQAKEINFHKTNVIGLLSQITGRTTEQVEEDMDRDNYMSPAEAVEYGLIDGVIDQESIMHIVDLPKIVSYDHREDIQLFGIKDIESEKIINPEVPDDEIY